jgi:hypothetical protein
MSFNARALFVYLRTCPESGLTGIFRLHLEDVVDELGLAAEDIEPALKELDENAFIVRDVALPRWLWLPGAFSDAPGIFAANPNHRRAAEKWLLRVPPGLAQLFRKTYFAEEPERIPEPFRERIDEPFPVPIAEPYADHDTRDTRHAERGTNGPQGREEGIDQSDCSRCGRDSCEGCEPETAVLLDDRLALLRRQADEITRERVG